MAPQPPLSSKPPQAFVSTRPSTTPSCPLRCPLLGPGAASPLPPKLHPASTPASTTPSTTLRHMPLRRSTARNGSTRLRRPPGIGADLRVLLRRATELGEAFSPWSVGRTSRGGRPHTTHADARNERRGHTAIVRAAGFSAPGACSKGRGSRIRGTPSERLARALGGGLSDNAAAPRTRPRQQASNSLDHMRL
jgi:hypothetical protein